MAHLSGKCLCGNIAFTADTDIKFTANCHCSDCRAATGAVYGTLLFIDEAALQVSGAPKVFKHVADSGADMEKHFCADCGSQLFGRNSNRPNMLSVARRRRRSNRIGRAGRQRLHVEPDRLHAD